MFLDPNECQDWCLYCQKTLDRCDCGIDRGLLELQGDELHDAIDEGDYDA